MPEKKYSKVKPSGFPKKQVQEFAERIAGKLGFEPGADLRPILQRLGGRLSIKDYWELEQADSGSILINAIGDFEIFVSSLTSGLRDRFTVAHEIGHYILHYLIPNSNGESLGPVCAYRYGSDREEWEANWFAASFLMPEERFRDCFRDQNGDLNVIASKFGVSRRAAQVRAESLGLL